MRKYAWYLLIFALINCGQTTESEESSAAKDTKMTTGNLHLDAAIAAHGGEAYPTAHLAFDFRERSFTLAHEHGAYTYTSRFSKAGQQYHDVLSNEGFTRMIDNEEMTLADSNITKYSNSLNSVIYFALLPHKLIDPAVRTKNKGQDTIKGEIYNVVEVTFVEEDGGTDFDDTFYYWLHQETNFVDYLAYNYRVDGGGVRFREAYNPRIVAGLRFQDYVNYKAPLETQLSELPDMLEAGTLKELSKIELRNIRSL